MFTTTEAYKQNQTAPLRAVDFEIEWGTVDVAARDNATVERSSPLLPFSKPAEILNDRAIFANEIIGTTERNGYLLDGNSLPTPTTPPAYETGGWSQVLSGPDGSCDVYFQIKTNVVILSDGLTIRFYKNLNQFAVDFDVVLLRSGTVVRTIPIVGNTTWERVISDTISDCDTIRLVFKKWNKALSFIKLYQIEFGIYLYFRPDNVTVLSVTNRASAISESLPYSTVLFKFINTGYDPMMERGKEKFVAERQPISLRVGRPGELYQNLDYVLTGLPVVDAHEVAITGYSFASLLQKKQPQQWKNNTTLYAIAQECFSACGIVSYEIDPALSTISFTGLLEKDYRETVADICVAGRCALTQTKDVVRISPLPLADTGYVIAANVSEFPVVSPQDAIGKCEVKTITYRTLPEAELTRYTAETAGQHVIGVKSARNMRVTGATLVSAGIDSVTVTAAAGAEVVIFGLEIEKTEIIQTFGTGNIVKSVGPNPFIRDAAAVAAWILKYHSRRQAVSIHWRQDNALQLLDVIQADSDFGRIKFIAEEQSIDFSGGGMSGTTAGRAIL